MEIAIRQPTLFAILQVYLDVKYIFEFLKVIFKHLSFKNFSLFGITSLVFYQHYFRIVHKLVVHSVHFFWHLLRPDWSFFGDTVSL